MAGRFGIFVKAAIPLNFLQSLKFPVELQRLPIENETDDDGEKEYKKLRKSEHMCRKAAGINPAAFSGEERFSR